jgi:hypothetical protein
MNTRKFDWWFNFSASPEGGGLKRLVETARWFNARGGALFFIHDTLKQLPIWGDLEKNAYIFLNINSRDRLLQKCHYLNDASKAFGNPKTYFSYGQPIPFGVADRNWLHISNALTLSRSVNLPAMTRLKNCILGHQILRSLIHADICSGESEFTLDLLRKRSIGRSIDVVLAPNGIDQALVDLSEKTRNVDSRVNAITVGTYSYKNLPATLALFKKLRSQSVTLQKLLIVGDPTLIPSHVASDLHVEILGRKSHGDVLALLAQSQAYISSSQIENSSNAALEGILLCKNSYLSDIPSHRELVRRLGLVGGDEKSNGVSDYLRVSGPVKNVKSLGTWDQVLTDMCHI